MTSSTAQNDIVLDSIRNGMIVEGHGHRAVSFSVDPSTGDVRVRTMISQKTMEREYGWNAGVQSLKTGDYVVISSWTPTTEKIQVFCNRKNGLVPTRNYGGSFNSRLLCKLPQSIINFLKPRGGGPSFLPPGPWRMKYDMFNSLPSRATSNFLKPWLPEDWLDYVVQEALKAPTQHLNIDWNGLHVKPLPDVLHAHEEFWTAGREEGSEVMVHNSMVWLIQHQDGTYTLHEPEPTSGHHYVGKSRRIIETFRATPLAMPSTAVRAIQLNIGAYEQDERSYGVRWFLFKK